LNLLIAEEVYDISNLPNTIIQIKQLIIDLTLQNHHQYTRMNHLFQDDILHS
jgi:hypothetical protein